MSFVELLGCAEIVSTTALSHFKDPLENRVIQNLLRQVIKYRGTGKKESLLKMFVRDILADQLLREQHVNAELMKDVCQWMGVDIYH